MKGNYTAWTRYVGVEIRQGQAFVNQNETLSLARTRQDSLFESRDVHLLSGTFDLEMKVEHIGFTGFDVVRFTDISRYELNSRFPKVGFIPSSIAYFDFSDLGLFTGRDLVENLDEQDVEGFVQYQNIYREPLGLEAEVGFMVDVDKTPVLTTYSVEMDFEDGFGFVELSVVSKDFEQCFTVYREMTESSGELAPNPGAMTRMNEEYMIPLAEYINNFVGP